MSDSELERQALNRIDFQHFLGFLGNASDYSTVWQFRERLAEIGTDRRVWEELQRQLKKGVVQDASFITSDPGHAPADKPRGGEARTRRSRDGTWAKKGSKTDFGYKLHAKTDTDYVLIRDLETTTASVHDTLIALIPVHHLT